MPQLAWIGAALAGIPKPVIAQAREYLTRLQSAQRQPKEQLQPQQQGLFTAPPSPVEEKLKSVAPDKLSPKEALELLYELKKGL